VTDVGIRASASSFDYEHPAVALRRTGRRTRIGPRSLLPWDLLMASAVAVAVSIMWPVVGPRIVIVLLGCWGTCLVLARAAEVSLVGSRAQALARVVRAGWAFALAGSALSILPGVGLSTSQAFAAAMTCTGLSCVARVVVLMWRPGAGCVLVVGDAAERQHAVAALERRAGPALQVVPVCIESDVGTAPLGEIAVPLSDLPAHARRMGAVAVVAIPGPRLDPVGLRRLQWVLEGERLPCYVGTGLLGVAPTRMATTDVGGLPLVRVHAARRSGPAWLLVHWTGRSLAAAALVLLLPLLLLLCIAIRRGSPGPAIYRQIRVGQDGRLFTIYKLRTMVAGPGPETALENDFDGVLFKMRRDPRITPLGAWLRKYSLDELPQLANVVLGQMRLVGPRPALPDEVAEYTEDARRRLAVRPGITGLWQVSGRSDLTWEETVRLDLHYVDNWTPGLDLLIVCRTLRAVLGHRGAY
jgi:lipopolysaccharide/colanic/teichoic acid biosynthesis glycosyltransferase